MTRALKVLPIVALVLTLGTGTAMAETAGGWGEDYGPGGTSFFSRSPVYTLSIRILDAVRPSLSPRHKILWTKYRDAALARWAASGVTFTVEVYKVDIYALGFQLEPNAITLGRGGSDCGGWSDAYQAGYAIFALDYPRTFYPKPVYAEFVIGHEIGHALGFGHGGDGVMWTGNAPNSEDLTLARTYYLGAAA